jgi:hypothetical protein
MGFLKRSDINFDFESIVKVPFHRILKTIYVIWTRCKVNKMKWVGYLINYFDLLLATTVTCLQQYSQDYFYSFLPHIYFKNDMNFQIILIRLINKQIPRIQRRLNNRYLCSNIKTLHSHLIIQPCINIYNIIILMM